MYNETKGNAHRANLCETELFYHELLLSHFTRNYKGSGAFGVRGS